MSSSDSQLFPPLLSKEEKRRGGYETQVQHQNFCSGCYIGSETPNFLMSFSEASKPAARSNSEEARQQFEMQCLEIKHFSDKEKDGHNTASLLLEGLKKRICSQTSNWKGGGTESPQLPVSLRSARLCLLPLPSAAFLFISSSWLSSSMAGHWESAPCKKADSGEATQHLSNRRGYCYRTSAE